ncbi:MAG: hypothetical protein ACLFT3_19405, partial [Cyclobacteriaceae bacterium]
MKISASLYSNKVKSLEELVRELDTLNIDSFHIDCNDDPSVFDDIARIRKISSTPIDLHIISSDPEAYLAKIMEHKVEYVQFQYENMEGRRFSLPRNKTRFGLAVVSDTPLEVFEAYKDDFSFILLMTTTQGFILILFTAMAGNELALYLGSALIGFNFGGNFALFPTITADVFGAKNVGQ